jgi:hypothetical protein
MTESKTETATIDFRELDSSVLEMARGGYLSEVMLNPQPLPPRTASHLSSFSWVMLNPQPLPPRVFQLR